MKIISEVFQISKYNDDSVFECMVFPHLDFECLSKENLRCVDKLLKYEKKIVYEGGGEYILPISDVINVMSDRFGFLVLFNENPARFSKEKEFPWFFERPNNAAIYNSDGSLRHQLIVPEQFKQQGWYIHSTYYADFPNMKGFGVMVTNDHHWPELCFCLYDGTPNLVLTGYSQERR